MALDFLSGIGSLISAGSSLAGMLSRDRKPAGYESAVAMSDKYRDLTDALTNPGNPTFVRLRDEEKTRSRDALTQAINEIIMRNRRQITRGPVGLFANQDRRDESISKALTQGYQDEDYRAGNKARDTIMRALGYAGGGIGANTQLAGFSNQLGFQNAGQIAGIGRMAGEGLKTIPDLFNLRNNNRDPMSSLAPGSASLTINDDAAQDWYPRGRNSQSMMFGGI